MSNDRLRGNSGLNPLFADHVESKEAHAVALSRRIEPSEAQRLLVKDLALHAALSYYAAVMKTGQSYPPRGETIIRTAETFEDYYEDLYVTKEEPA
jgi:hypothetical protein